MLNATASAPSPTCQDREARIQALLGQLRPSAELALRQMVEALVDTPEAQLFGDLEFQLREHAHALAAAAHQTGLEDRKKGGIKDAASPVLPAERAPTL
jgi:hypothetical protein